MQEDKNNRKKAKEKRMLIIRAFCKNNQNRKQQEIYKTIIRLHATSFGELSAFDLIASFEGYMKLAIELSI